MFYEMFSHREAGKTKAGQDDVFQYDTLPTAFRVQVDHLLADLIGSWTPRFESHANVNWMEIFKAFTKEKGVYHLGLDGLNPHAQISKYIQTCKTDDALDLIDLCFWWVDNCLRYSATSQYDEAAILKINRAIQELNLRFRKHGIGYEFTDSQLIRIDSKYVHAEAVRPAIQLLHAAGNSFQGPLLEFLDAHRKYREGEHKDAVTAACRSFESVMKSICTEQGWKFEPTRDTASRLIDIIFSNKLIPSYMQEQFTTLRKVLESGVPTARNKTSGHGQGPTPTELPDHFVSYVLHLTASNIVFLIESHKALS